MKVKCQTENWGLLNLSYLIKKIEKEVTSISKLKVRGMLSMNWKKMKQLIKNF